MLVSFPSDPAAAEVDQERIEPQRAERARLAQEVPLAAAVAVEQDDDGSRGALRDEPTLEEGAVAAAEAMPFIG
jgi:hypothetical protein